MIKEYRLGFRADNEILEGLEKLSKKLGVVQSEVVRIGIRKLMEDYLEIKSDIILMGRTEFEVVVREFSKQLRQDLTQKLIEEVRKSPEIRKLYELAKKGELEVEK